MRAWIQRLQQIEFEGRIFVSFAIVAAVLAAAWTFFAHVPTTSAILGRAAGLDATTAHHAGFPLAAVIVAGAMLLRMAAGSVLTSKRVMAFKVQDDALATCGPYRLSRNPIYLADWTAFVGFTLVLPPIGLLLPALLYVHYAQIIQHEERALASRFATRYRTYLRSAPRFFPTQQSIEGLWRAIGELEINRDGVRHNALYALFLPGLIVAAFTGQFWHAFLIGLPATLDWAVVHTRIGLSHDASSGKEVCREA